MRVGNTIDVEGNKIDVEDDFSFDSSNCSFACVILTTIITPLTETVVFLPGAFVRTVVCDTQAVVDLRRAFVMDPQMMPSALLNQIV